MAIAKVIISNRQKEIKIPAGVRLLMRRCCQAVLQEEGFPEPAEICISFISNEEIKKLNHEFRGVDAVTDVLSFPLGENGVYDRNPDTGALQLGDIAISMQKAEQQAEQYGHSFEREVGFLTCHSMLHLLGYDHICDADRVIMRRKEEEILKILKLTRDEQRG